MPYQRKLGWVLIAVTAIGVFAAAIWGRGVWRGRAAVLVLAVGAASWFIVAAIAHRRYVGSLKEAASRLGLAFLGRPADEGRAAFLAEMRKKAESDVFRWKVDGKFPAIAGLFEDIPVAVRVPVGLDFDAAAPDSTRIAAYLPNKLTGFTIYDRPRLKKTPKGRAAEFADDPAFQARFLVLAHRPEEARSVLTAAVRAKLLEEGATGFRGIEVSRYGVFLHEEGKVSDAALVERRLRLVVALAAAVKAAVGARN